MIFEYYESVREEIKNEVADLSDSYLLSVDTKEYEGYLFQKYSLREIEFVSNRKPLIEKVRETKVHDNYWGREERNYLVVRIKLAVVDNETVSRVLALSPSRSTTSPPTMVYEHGFIATEASPDEPEVRKAIEYVRREVEWRNSDIRQQNEALKRIVSSSISSRRKTIQDEDALLEQIAKKVSVELRRKEQVSPLPPSPVRVKEKIQPIMPPEPKPLTELHLEKAEFDGILRLIDNCCAMFERSPATFSKMDEEELRDVILANLNGVFEGSAVGEAFSKSGKTDIYLKVEKGGVFIAECKYWRGGKSVAAAVAQILDYLTWRENYGVIVVFSKNKGFSEVVESVQPVLKGEPSYVRGFQKVTDKHFISEHRLPEDEKKLVEIHTLVYNLYSEKSPK